MSNIIERTVFDQSGISIESVSDIDAMIERSTMTEIPLHQHNCCELILVQRGSCKVYSEYSYKPLLKGDLFLCFPNYMHAFSLSERVSFVKIQFEADLFMKKASFRKSASHLPEAEEAPMQKHLNSIMAFSDHDKNLSDSEETETEGYYKIFHLTPDQVEQISGMMLEIQNEQTERFLGFEEMKRIYLEQLLLQLQRIQVKQVSTVSKTFTWKEDLVANVLKMIDENPAKQHDFEAFAQKEGITLNYFRMLFKEETGMTPVNYLNKVRILRALELLQTSDLSIAEISAVIGIYDANYFSRLFKKVTGSPPRYFKAIAATQNKEGN